MEEYLKIWPNLFQMRLAGQFHHAVEYRKHPRRYTADVGDVFRHGLAGYAVSLLLEVRQQGCLLLGYADKVYQRIDVLNQNGTQVAYQRTRQIVVRGMAATQDEATSVEHAALGIVSQVDGYRVIAPGIVDLLQTFIADGNELRLVVRCSARLRVPLYTSGP